MKLAERIFRRKDYTLTSPFGPRNIISTSGGKTSSIHNGTDYGTKGQKWAQYALEEGTIALAHTDETGAKIVYVNYPRLGIRLQHAHLDSISVKTGQSVNENTILGYTGKSGKATGIHLHLGFRKIGNATWLNPESYDYLPKQVKIKVPTEYIGATVSKMESVDQIEILVKQLIVREGPGLEYNRLGYANLGYYNKKTTLFKDGYTWFEIGSNMFVPDNGKWLREVPKIVSETVIPIELPKEEEKPKEIEEIPKKEEEIPEKEVDKDYNKKLYEIIVELIKKIIESIRGVLWK